MFFLSPDSMTDGKQAIAQACAFRSPFWVTMSAVAIYRPLHIVFALRLTEIDSYHPAWVCRLVTESWDHQRFKS